MSKTKSIFVTTSFVAYHRWADAPQPVNYLRNFHRHVFGVRLEVSVPHNERAIEYHTLLKGLNAFLQLEFAFQYHDHSCETFAEKIVDHYKTIYTTHDVSCTVDEDGENGSIVDFFYQGEDEVNGEGTCVGMGSNARPVHEMENILLEDGTVQLRQVTRLITGGTEQNPATECFVGIEAEGPPKMRGKGTLFVPGSITPVEFYKAAAIAFSKWFSSPGFVTHNKPLTRCYYGAGNDRNIRQDTLDAILTVFKPDELCVELSVFKNYYQKLKDAQDGGTIIVQIDNQDRQYFNWKKQIAVTTGGKAVVWINRNDDSSTYITHLNDPLFAQDVKVSNL